jgi:hypothetical protein
MPAGMLYYEQGIFRIFYISGRGKSSEIWDLITIGD